MATLKEIMEAWSKVWQPTYDDIDKWKTIKDIGHIEPTTLQLWKDAWATLPAADQKSIYKAFELLRDRLDSDTLRQLIELYFKLIGKK